MTIRDIFAEKKVWLGMLLAYPCLLALTMWKDYVVTHQMPNILFYATVPEIGMVGSCFAILLLNKLTRHDIHILDIAKIIVLSEFLFQIWENLAKVVYYWLWHYPGMLWFIVFPLNLWLVSALFRHISKTSWRYSVVLAVVSACSSMIAGLLWMSLTGIETFGS